MENYVTKLPHPIELSGDWEVALVQIVYTNSFYNVVKGQNTISATFPDAFKNQSENSTLEMESVVIKEIPVGYYYSMDHLISVMNSNAMCNVFFSCFNHNNLTGHVSLKTDENKPPVDILLCPGLAGILGFDSDKPIKGRGERPSRLDYNVPSEIFIYTDIADDTITGDTLCPLLYIMPVENTKFGGHTSKIFNAPHYVPVKQRYFETIEIDIRTSRGEKAPFRFGSLTTKLHFRPLNQ